VVVTSRRHGFAVEMSCPPDPSELELTAVQDATDRVLGGSRSAQESSTMGVASFRVPETEPATPDWVAAPVDQATGTVGRAMVALGTSPEPFGPDDEAVLALLARMASVALERASLYETLRSNEQRLTVLVESSPLAIAELNLDGTVRWWNRAAGYLFGWDESGLAPRAIPVAGEAASMLDSLWDRARLGMATVGALVPARRPGGELMELSLSVAPLEENDGSTGGILAVAEDATEREQVLEQFHRSQRLGAMARLAGGIAHDFNNLVTVILASSETLMKRIATDDPLRPEVEAIHRVGKRAAALTGQLLQIGHRSSLQLVETDPAEVIAAMSDDLRRLFGPHVGVEITTDRANSPLLVLVDRAELERAVLNLAFNARDAMPQGGRLSIETRLARDEAGTKCWVVISMSDTGIGMDPSTAEHCFEPFFTTKGSASGTGLGLATVHAIVTQSNGSVNVESTPGVGTTFTLRFPFAGKPAIPAAEPKIRVQPSNR
jgi:two-component system cell cycle sensor histidine kinase/response regulator CckA